MTQQMLPRPIRQLNAEVARKIAAGEVIDRPNAIIRELLDNAVDSGANAITVEIDGGGIERIRIVDNGCGMTEEDLAICARPHATSKISTETDLLNLTTLGFRGEALSSIAAVSRLSITSGSKCLRISVTEDHIIEPTQPVEGTIVQTEALFENFPARRLFLKRPAAETIMCRNTFVEKTLPRPDISFRLTTDGKVKLDLPRGQSFEERFTQATGIQENPDLFYEINRKSDDWKFRLIIGDPAVSRSDKKLLYIFVNGRRITEFSLIQAIEYGSQGYFPNGTHPVAALFVDINPALVDFNIHPAKKEARFQDISALHHAISTSVRDFFHHYTINTMKELKTGIINSTEPAQLPLEKSVYADQSPACRQDNCTDVRSRFFPDGAKKNDTFTLPEVNYRIQNSVSRLADNAAEIQEKSEEPDTFRYIGTVLGVFLIVEKDDTLYIIDQHAAHERILYNRIMASQGKKQNLLVPYVIETMSASDDTYLEGIQQELDDVGFSAVNCGNGRWEFHSLPERWQGTENDLARGLLDKRLEPGEIISSLAALSACKAAVKDGYVLDEGTAANLAKQALELPDPHCPHGRPVYAAITRKELFALVKRT